MWKWGGIALATTAVLISCIDDAEARRRRGRMGHGVHSGQRVDGPVLDRDELSRCIRIQSTIDEMTEKLSADERMISSLRRSLDRTDPIAVADFNDAIRHYNLTVEVIDDHIDNFNALCADKAYYADDAEFAERAARRRETGPATTTPQFQCNPNTVLGPMACVNPAPAR